MTYVAQITDILAIHLKTKGIFCSLLVFSLNLHIYLQGHSAAYHKAAFCTYGRCQV